MRINANEPRRPNGVRKPVTAKTPGLRPSTEWNSLPRSRAPGPVVVVSAPAKHIPSSLKLPQPGQAVDRGTQSATHSITFPTMSKAPTSETQLLREPVATKASTPAPPPLAVLQSCDPAADTPE